MPGCSLVAEMQKLLYHVHAVATEDELRTRRPVSRLVTAQRLDAERKVAKNGKEMGLTTYVRQLPAPKDGDWA